MNLMQEREIAAVEHRNHSAAWLDAGLRTAS
jgi:hypothetical protein